MECAAPTTAARSLRQILNSSPFGAAYAPMSDTALLGLLIFICGACFGGLLTYIVVAGMGGSGAQRPCPTGPLHVAGLFVYPIKSCAGYAVDRATLTPRGLEHDRTYVLVDAKCRFLSQRRCPRMALVCPRVMDDGLVIAAGDKQFQHSPLVDGENVAVTVWSDECAGVDQGDEVAAFLSEFLDMECRLMRMADDHVRPVDDEGYVTPGDFETSFSDGYPYLLATEASRVEVCRQAGREISMKRFRPNIVVEGDGNEPFVEDYWEMAIIGATLFHMPKISSRCKVPTVNDAGCFDKDNEPTETLKKIHSVGNKVLFGQNAVCTKGNGEEVVVGDMVKIVSMHSERKV